MKRRSCSNNNLQDGYEHGNGSQTGLRGFPIRTSSRELPKQRQRVTLLFPPCTPLSLEARKFGDTDAARLSYSLQSTRIYESNVEILQFPAPPTHPWSSNPTAFDNRFSRSLDASDTATQVSPGSTGASVFSITDTVNSLRTAWISDYEALEPIGRSRRVSSNLYELGNMDDTEASLGKISLQSENQPLLQSLPPTAPNGIGRLPLLRTRKGGAPSLLPSLSSPCTSPPGSPPQQSLSTLMAPVDTLATPTIRYRHENLQKPHPEAPPSSLVPSRRPPSPFPTSFMEFDSDDEGAGPTFRQRTNSATAFLHGRRDRKMSAKIVVSDVPGASTPTIDTLPKEQKAKRPRLRQLVQWIAHLLACSREAKRRRKALEDEESGKEKAL
ncbi:hypothetical protein MMC25_006467 [Agyrium rufum]|nr:hypothetical protein [Agyrium rufum]